MSEPTPQQKANLARIRYKQATERTQTLEKRLIPSAPVDNQRRSRARRKEYLQELETKYRSCEAIGAEASQEIQSAARKVLEENKRLRRLLRQQGFSDTDIDGPEHDEFASSPSAAEMLDVMLVTRKPCQPSSGSGSGCGDSQVCKTEDEDDIESRRQSVISTPAAPACAPSKPQQKQLRPIALAPAPVSAPAPVPAVAPASRPRSHEPSAPNQQLPQHQHFQPQGEQHMQFQGHPQHHHLQPQQQQQFFMSPPQHASAPLAPHQNVHASPGAFVNDYPIYAPQPFGYPVPQSQLLDWDMAAAEAIPQSGTYTSPQSGFSTSGTYASPTHSSTATYNQQDSTSSCFAAAGAIRALHSEAGDEVESALGCRADGNECRVDNAMVFDLMDRYSGVQGQQGSI
ncbi:unnamed protein product [Aureobasidium vineae]|uniref:BZIP domain-containing protein n=1 Tax=Aureobasidium vineae TaxID=2773715 RepID=A0A9N8JN37_9PEZI|nr:unnamed protein product [Aureobasidium vineae]